MPGRLTRGVEEYMIMGEKTNLKVEQEVYI